MLRYIMHNTQPTNSNQYTFPDGTTIDFGNCDPQKCLDDYVAWKSGVSKAPTNSIDSELEKSLWQLALVNPETVTQMDVDQALQAIKALYRKEIEEAIGEDEHEFTLKRHRMYQDTDTEKLWDLANGVEPVSASEFALWGSSAQAQFRKFALKLRDKIWKSNEESRNELRAELRAKLLPPTKGDNDER